MAQKVSKSLLKDEKAVLEYDAYALLAVRQVAGQVGHMPSTEADQAQFALATSSVACLVHQRQHVTLMTAAQRAAEADEHIAQLDVPQAVGQLRRLVDKDARYTLDVLDVLEQARTGSVKFKINDKNDATRARTSHLLDITTRQQAHEHLIRLQQGRVARSLKPGYLEKRVFYVKWFVRYSLVTWGVIAWYTPECAAAFQLRLEGFHNIVCERYGPTGCGAQAVTHVIQWHLTVLRIVVPPNPLLTNDKRLESRNARKHAKSIAKAPRRGYNRPQVEEACVDMREISLGRPVTTFAAPPTAAARLEAAVMRFVLAAAWWLVMRVGELCRGGEYDPAIHWSREWLILAGWLRVQIGGAAITDQTEKKQDGNVQHDAFSFEAVPVLYLDLPHNPIAAFRDLVALDPLLPSSQHFAANCITDSGLPPTTDAACDYLQRQGRRLWPKEAEFMDWTCHCAQIGAITTMQDLGVDNTAQCHMASKSLTSGTSELYRRRTMHRMCQTQSQMAVSSTVIMRDTFGTRAPVPGSTGPSKPAGAAAAHEQALSGVGSLQSTELPELQGFYFEQGQPDSADVPEPQAAIAPIVQAAQPTMQDMWGPARQASHSSAEQRPRKRASTAAIAAAPSGALSSTVHRPPAAAATGPLLQLTAAAHS